jgi:hypothetical protein
MLTHKNLIDYMVAGRGTVSDEAALEVITLYPKWEENIGKTITNDDITNGLNRYQHNGKLYKVVQPTVLQEQYEPGAEGTSSIFVEISLEEWSEWVQPTGAHDAYAKDAKVKHNGKKWVSTYDGANVWEPGVYGWSEYVQP